MKSHDIEMIVPDIQLNHAGNLSFFRIENTMKTF